MPEPDIDSQPSDEAEDLFEEGGGKTKTPKSGSKPNSTSDQSRGALQNAKDIHGNIKDQGLGQGINTSAAQGSFGRNAQNASKIAGNIKGQGVKKGLSSSANEGNLGNSAKNVSKTAGNIKDQGLKKGVATSAGEGNLGETAQKAAGAAKNIKDEGLAGGLAKSAGEGHLGETAQGGAKVAEGAVKRDAGRVAEGAVQIAGGDKTSQATAKHAARIGKIAVDVAAAETGAGAVEAVKDTYAEVKDVATHPEEVAEIGGRAAKVIGLFVIVFFAVIILIVAIFADISGGSQKAADFNSGALCPAQYVPNINIQRLLKHTPFDTSDIYSLAAKKWKIRTPGLIAAIDFREASNYMVDDCAGWCANNGSGDSCIAGCEARNKDLITCRADEIGKKIREGATAVKNNISPAFALDPVNTWIDVDDYGTLLAGLGYFQTIDKGLDPKNYKPVTDPWIMNMFAQPDPKDKDGNIIKDSVENQIIKSYGGNKSDIPIGAATYFKIISAWISKTDGCNVCSFDPFGYQAPEPPPVDPGTPPSDSNKCHALVYTNITDDAKYATAIDKYIKDTFPGSQWLDEMNNKPGSFVVSGAKSENVNPALVTCIGAHESAFATGTNYGHNSFGRRATPSQPHVITSTGMWYAWPSYKASLVASDSESNFIKVTYINGFKVTDLASFVHIYAPSSDGNDEAGYVSFLKTCMDKINGYAGSAIDCN